MIFADLVRGILNKYFNVRLLAAEHNLQIILVICTTDNEVKKRNCYKDSNI